MHWHDFAPSPRPCERKGATTRHGADASACPTPQGRHRPDPRTHPTTRSASRQPTASRPTQVPSQASLTEEPWIQAQVTLQLGDEVENDVEIHVYSPVVRHGGRDHLEVVLVTELGPPASQLLDHVHGSPGRRSDSSRGRRIDGERVAYREIIAIEMKEVLRLSGRRSLPAAAGAAARIMSRICVRDATHGPGNVSRCARAAVSSSAPSPRRAVFALLPPHAHHLHRCGREGPAWGPETTPQTIARSGRRSTVDVGVGHA
jgi:hypothetical protein